ncbi:hypothetical protein PCYB_004730, partial [Plasmodium cynomolgi strain B]
MCIDNDELKTALGHIEHDHKRMKILDRLYQSYCEMHEIIISTSEENIEKYLVYTTDCFNEYRGAISTVPINDKYFHSALTNFKKAYEELADRALIKNTSHEEYIEKMAEYSITSDMILYSMENDSNKIMLISIFSSVLAVVLILIYFYMVKIILIR